MALEFLYFGLNAIYLWRMFYILSPVGFGDSACWLLCERSSAAGEGKSGKL